MADKDGFDRLGDEFDQAGRMTATFERELSRLQATMGDTGREIGSLTTGFGSGLRRAFDGVVFDGMRLQDALKGIARNMADTVFAAAMRPVQGAVAGAMAQAVGGAIGSAQPFAQGGVFSQGRVTAFARGGVVTDPTYFPMRGATGLMGEAGPEAIMPLRRGADGRLGVAAPGGGARAVNVTVNVTTPDVAGFQRSHSQIAAQMSRALARGERNS